MRALIFKHNDQSSKQHEIARYFVNRLRKESQADFPCDNFEASIKLAHLVMTYNNERLCAAIEIHPTFVRLIAKKAGTFSFEPTVMYFNNRGLWFKEAETPVK